MDKRCKILSRVQGKDIFGNTFYRGIYLGGEACSIPKYYHYTINANGRDADYSIYPVVWMESWLTNPDYLGLTGKLIFPR
jgi:hypothetical protein